jgi:hypothetical protein
VKSPAVPDPPVDGRTGGTEPRGRGGGVARGGSGFGGDDFGSGDDCFEDGSGGGSSAGPGRKIRAKSSGTDDPGTCLGGPTGPDTSPPRAPPAASLDADPASPPGIGRNSCVNSPGWFGAGGGGGGGGGCGAGRGGAGRDGFSADGWSGAAAGSPCCALNIRVNSPGSFAGGGVAGGWSGVGSGRL